MGDGGGKEVEKRLVAESEVIYLVMDFGDFGPGEAGVGGAENWEVDQWWFWGVVFPGCSIKKN